MYEPTLQVVVDRGRKFLRDVENTQWDAGMGWWLTLSGDPGCGKTTLIRSLYEQAAKFNPGNASLWVAGNGIYGDHNRRPRSVFMTATEFADQMKGGDWKLPEYLARDFLVAIDDVGATRDKTDFLNEALYRLAMARMGKWTLFTTNLSLVEMAESLDGRFASRMVRDGNTIIRIKAPDYALRR